VASLISLILAILLFFSFSVDETPTAAVTTQTMSNAPLTIEEEPVVRLAQTTAGTDMAYVASENSLFKLTGTDDWTRVTDAPPDGRIVFAADDPKFMMIGDEAACARGGGGDSLQISEDGGVTWTATSEENLIRPLAIWKDSGIAVGSSCEGLLVSKDLGETWNVINDDLLGLQVTAFAAVEGQDQVVLAGLTGEGGTSRLYRFDLNDEMSMEPAEPLAEYYGIAGLAGSDETIYLASITGVSSTIDNGETWSTYRLGLEGVTLERDPAIEGFPQDFDPSGYGLNAIFLDEGSPLLVGAKSEIYEFWSTDVRSADAATWEVLISTPGPVTAFGAIPSGEGVLAQTEYGVWLVHPGPWSE
jgi:hypothetical protein